MTSLDDRREAVTEDDVDREAWVELLKGTWEEKRLGFESFASKTASCERLKLAGSDLLPEAALANRRRNQRHTVSIDSGAPIHGVSTVQPRQAAALAALRIKKPTLDAQLSLL